MHASALPNLGRSLSERKPKGCGASFPGDLGKGIFGNISTETGNIWLECRLNPADRKTRKYLLGQTGAASSPMGGPTSAQEPANRLSRSRSAHSQYPRAGRTQPAAARLFMRGAQSL